MRRSTGFGFVLAAAAVVGMTAASAPKLGTSSAYETLGKLAVMNKGRVKPLDTLARHEVKEIYSRATIKFYDSEGEATSSWGPVAAFYDWTVRPEFWADQPFVLVEYLPLKQLLLADAVKGRLAAIVAAKETPADVKATAETLLAAPEFAAVDLNKLSLRAGVSESDKKELQALAAKLGEGGKWMSPKEIENAQVSVEGKRVSFLDWFNDIRQRKEESGRKSKIRAPRLSTLEERAFEVGVRLFHFMGIRGDRGVRVDPFDSIVPRPHNESYLKFTASAFEKMKKAYQENGSVDDRSGLTSLETDAAHTLLTYYQDKQQKDQKVPGTDPEFDKWYVAWLKETGDWVSLRTVKESSPEELERAGYPRKELVAFLAAEKGMREAEESSPGDAPVEKAVAFVDSARRLGESLESYPTPFKVAAESHFNRFGPFFKAPMAYGTGLVLLLLCLGISAQPDTAAAALRKALYVAGMLGFVGGIGLEIYGFALRVVISGWAPVTNMYETVIWVALVASVIGLVLEILGRKVYPALAASGVATLATLLAANVPLLDPSIGSLTPVLQSNLWLSIHVLTIVSSYAAFALAMGLGLTAVCIYLTTTYKRSVGYLELAKPLPWSVPMLVLGALGWYGSSMGPESSMAISPALFYPSAVAALLGGFTTVMATFGVLGEAVNRSPRRLLAPGMAILAIGGLALAASQLPVVPSASASVVSAVAGPIAGVGLVLAVLSFFGVVVGGLPRLSMAESDHAADVGGESELAANAANHANGFARAGSASSSSKAWGGSVATLAKPSVAEIRARTDAGRTKLGPREEAMQKTAARIKPLAGFIYRAMQVGVLLVAAGTILGGVWADYSWGRFWGWDQKEVWALITLLVYLVPLHGRFAGWVNTFWLVVASVVCFGSVLMAWYGVNFVLGVGLHSYGFTEGGGQGVVISCTVAVLGIVGAAWWRRTLASQPGRASAIA